MDERKNYSKTEQTHNIIMENRKRMSVSGVKDVDSFNESSVLLATSMGMLTVKGADLRINKLNIESGEVSIEGEIDSFEYSDVSMGNDGGGFLSRLFK